MFMVCKCDMSNEESGGSDVLPNNPALRVVVNDDSNLDTQSVCSHMDMEYDSKDSPPLAWARLLPLHRAFKPQDLTKDLMVFGRNDNVDYSFATLDPVPPVFGGISKRHFTIQRGGSSSGLQHTVVVDHSSNGTFINGIKIGRNKKSVIKHQDEIAIVHVNNKAFLFVDNSASFDDSEFPAEIRDKYAVMKTLGKGAMGVVHLAFLRSNPRESVAIKVINTKNFPASSVQRTNIKREIQILSRLDHPFVIGVEDVVQTPRSTYIIMEMVEGGELFDRVTDENRPFSEDLAKIYSYQIFDALQYLHHQKITHRDLKLENVLISSSMDEPATIKIADFGLSKLTDSRTMLKTFCGTANYLAPEIVANGGMGREYTEKVDVWSAAVIVFTLLAQYQPFADGQGEGGLSMKDQILQGKYFWIQYIWDRKSHLAADFVKSLLVVDAKKRPSADEALQHPWFMTDTSMLEKVDGLVQKYARPQQNNLRKKHMAISDAPTPKMAK